MRRESIHVPVEGGVIDYVIDYVISEGEVKDRVKRMRE